MFQAAQAVQNGRQISDYLDAGGVAAAILSSSEKNIRGCLCGYLHYIGNMC